MDGGGYGQNIAAGVSDDQIDRVITNMFYDSEVQAFANNYGNPSPGGFEEWGHFSQMVWVNTVEVACVTKKCDKLENTGGNVPPYFTVCNYSPPGNTSQSDFTVWPALTSLRQRQRPIRHQREQARWHGTSVR